MVANLTTGRRYPTGPIRSIRSSTSEVDTRVAYLDGIRGIAILAVVLYHATVEHLLLGVRVPGGYVGVDVFFVLSGFIITRILSGSGTADFALIRYRRFMAGRVRRLYPALLGVVGTVLLVVGLGWHPAGAGSGLGTARWAAVALGQLSTFFFAGHASAPNVFSPTWTLSIEWMFYLVWPFVVWRLHDASRPDLVILVAAVALYAWSLLIPPTAWWVLPPGRFAQLMAGGALALWQRRSDWDGMRDRQHRRARVVAVIGLGAIVLWCVRIGPGPAFPGFRQIGAPLMTISAVAVIHGGSRPGLVRAALSCRPLVALGRVSYSLYLVHLPWMLALGGSYGVTRPWWDTVYAAGAIAMCTVVCFRLLERPYLKRHAESHLIAATG